MAKQQTQGSGGAKNAEQSRFEIRTPNAGFNGERAGVRFRDGVGFTSDETAAEELAGFGYAVSLDGKVICPCFKITGANLQSLRGQPGMQYLGEYAVTTNAKQAKACREQGCDVI